MAVSINVVAILFMLASVVAVVITMRAINKHAKNIDFVALLIFQLSLVLFFAVNLTE